MIHGDIITHTKKLKVKVLGVWRTILIYRDFKYYVKGDPLFQGLGVWCSGWRLDKK